MQRKAELSTALVERLASDPLLAAVVEALALKQLFRQGWLKAGIPREACESVADHSFGVALLAMFFADEYAPSLDREKVLRMALVHDLGEAYAGDFTPGDALPAEEKHQLEAQGVDKIFKKLPHGDVYRALWEEYEHSETPEARLVHDLDRLEMALQALVYAEQGAPDLDAFYASAGRSIQSPEVLLRLDSILRNRRPANSISE